MPRKNRLNKLKDYKESLNLKAIAAADEWQASYNERKSKSGKKSLIFTLHSEPLNYYHLLNSTNQDTFIEDLIKAGFFPDEILNKLAWLEMFFNKTKRGLKTNYTQLFKAFQYINFINRWLDVKEETICR